MNRIRHLCFGSIILIALTSNVISQCNNNGNCIKGNCEEKACKCDRGYIGSLCDESFNITTEVSSSVLQLGGQTILKATVVSPKKPGLTIKTPTDETLSVTSTDDMSPFEFEYNLLNVTFASVGQYNFTTTTSNTDTTYETSDTSEIEYVLTLDISTKESTVYFEEEKPATLKINISVTGNSSTISATLKKDKEEYLVQEGKNNIFHTFVGGIRVENSGTYLFEVIEAFGEVDRVKSQEINVIVEVPAKKPKIDVPTGQDSVNVIKGVHATLTCTEPSGVPDSIITWSMLDKDVSLSDLDMVYQKNGNLIFTKSTSYDANGTYTCNAKNTLKSTGMKEQNTSITVNIQGPPELAFDNAPMPIKEAGNEFSCTFDGFPLPDIIWKFNETTVDHLDDQIGVTVVDDETEYYRRTSKLTINHSTRCLGIGKISCLARNSLGQNISKEFDVNEEPYGVYKDSYIIFSKEMKNFENASTYCEALGGNLLDIRSMDDQKPINEIADKFNFKEFYIGYKFENNMWNWSNNPSNNYTIWQGSAPTSGCAVNKKDADVWSWSAITCSDVKQFACKVKASKAPTGITIMPDKCDGTSSIVTWIPDGNFNQSISVTDPSGMPQTVDKDTTTFRFTDLLYGTDYILKVETGIGICAFNPYAEIRFKTAFEKALSPTVTVNSTTCEVSWSYPDEDRVKEIDNFKIVITEAQNSGTTEIITKTNDTTLEYSTSIETRPNSLYRISLQTQSCIENSDIVEETCTTNVEAPVLTIVPNITLSTVDAAAGISFQLEEISERNGKIECLFVVVRWRRSEDFDVIQLNSTLYENIRQGESELSENEDYFAFAVENKSQNLTLGVDPKESFCPSNERQKRSTSVSNKRIRAFNRPLNSDVFYRFYIIAAVRDNGNWIISNSTWSSSVKVNKSTSPTSVLSIVLPIIIIILLIAIVIVGIFLWKRRQTKAEEQSERPPANTSQANINEAFVDNVYENISKDTSIAAENLRSTYKTKHADDNRLFREEYRALATEVSELSINYSYAMAAEVRDKNRFSNIHPANENRVVLRKEGIDIYSDYINASYLDGYRHPRKFVAAQGPLANTIGDFWYMIWEQESTVIVMLTKVDENGRRKCEKYWPDDNEQTTFDNLIVKSISSTAFGPILQRVFHLSNPNQSEKRLIVKQFQFLTWPDHGVPVTTSALINLRRMVIESQGNNPSPIIVHCSAGVGRTGTFVVFDYLCHQIERESKVDVYGAVLSMRKKRKEIVQTVEQYGFLHKLMLEKHLFRFSDVKTADFGSGHGYADDENEFYNLSIASPFRAYLCNPGDETDKIRDTEAVSYEHSRVVIRMRPSEEKARFINASHVQTYSRVESFIACQAPVDAGIEDFWRVVLDNNVTTIVMLSRLYEDNEEHCSRYWPEDEETPILFGDVTVSLQSSTREDGYTERMLKVDEKVLHLRRSQNILQLQFDEWPKDSVPTDAFKILNLISKAQTNRKATQGASAPVLVHCRDGSARTGTFCAIVNLIERLKIEDRIDIFRTVKDLRDMRLLMVRTLGQYRFCRQAVREYLDSFQLYSNFK